MRVWRSLLQIAWQAETRMDSSRIHISTNEHSVLAIATERGSCDGGVMLVDVREEKREALAHFRLPVRARQHHRHAFAQETFDGETLVVRRRVPAAWIEVHLTARERALGIEKDLRLE